MYKTRIIFSFCVLPSTLLAFATFFTLFTCFQQSVFAQPGTIKSLKTIDKFSDDALMPLQYHPTSLQYSPAILPLTKRLNIESQKINWTRIAVTSTALAGIYTGLFSYEQNKRWGVPQVPFHFAHSLKTKGVDKAGHFNATKAQASFISNLYTLSNVSSRTSNIIGVGVALSVQTIVELKDGRSIDRGFGIYDEMANLLGAGWFYTRQQNEFLQRFQIRWLYYPSNLDMLQSGYRFTEDYTGHSYWLSMKIWDILPLYWPKLIVPAVGITLNEWTPNANKEGYYSVHLSLNPDFSYIFPQRTAFGRTLADFFNSFYIPAPAIQIYPDFGFKLIFYGQK